MEPMNADHRPWPVPNRLWVMKQTWEHLLFAHWEMHPSRLRELIPAELQLDTYDGKAWIAIIPFGMSGIHLRGLPPIPGTSTFLEINVRTYVTHQGKPGVFFFSLDAANKLAVALARRFLHLPYYHAEMKLTRSGSTISYTCRRTHRNVPPAEFNGSYAPSSQVYYAAQGSLESWLVERYCLYTVHERKIYRGEIHHDPWLLQRAEADIHFNSMAQSSRITLPDTAPLLHYADKLNVKVWPFQECSIR